MRESPYGSLRTLSDAEVKVIKESKDPALMAEVDRAVEEAEAGLRKLKEDRDRAEQEEREREEMLRRERDAVYKAERERQEAAQRQAQEDERLRLEAIAQEKAALYVDNAFGQF